MGRLYSARHLVVAAVGATPVVAALLAISGAACSSSASHSGAQAQDASSETGVGSGPPAADDGGNTVALKWQVVASPTPGTGPAPDPDAGSMGIPDVTVCVNGHAEIPCAMTGPDGTFSLPGLPQATDVVVTFKKDGYVPALKAVETARTDMQTTNPIPMFLSSDSQPDLGFPIDMQQKGAVFFFAIGPAPPDSGAQFGPDQGATVTLSPTSGNGPLYGDNNFFDASAMSIVGGAGEYYNVDPGDYVLTVDDPNHNCAPISFPFGGWGYPLPPASVKFPVLAGYMTVQVGFLCTPKARIVPVDGG
jgi:hypothetical protein